MGARIDILKNSVWTSLVLENDTEIKYNAVINKIGNISSREISHTNTFKIPKIPENINVLDLNRYNPKAIAKALNTKYKARYYVDNRLFQEGYLVINNTEDDINVNFIDEALDIVDKWSEKTFREVLRDDSITKPSGIQSFLDIVKAYPVSKVDLVEQVPEVVVDSIQYPFMYFPNNLNAVGDKWQNQEDGTRIIDDRFNPYQSRPIFSMRGFLDIATRCYGYTFEENITFDNQKNRDTYMVSDGLASGDANKAITLERNFYNNGAYRSVDRVNEKVSAAVWSDLYSQSYLKIPNDYPYWVTPPEFNIDGTIIFDRGFEQTSCLYVPDRRAGYINFKADPDYGEYTWISRSYKVYSFWYDQISGSFSYNSTPIIINAEDSDTKIDISVDKETIQPSEGNFGVLLGVIFHIQVSRGDFDSTIINLFNKVLTETSQPDDVVSFDEHQQYLANVVDLTFAAPNKSIKELFSAYLQKEGLLLNIDSKLKKIKLFSYSYYTVQKNNGVYLDWTKYLLKYDGYKIDTNYGTSYGIINRIGLNTPYKGNDNKIILNNQGFDSKYPPIKDNLSKLFKDVSQVFYVGNPNNPYFEYTNLGLGLVEFTGLIGDDILPLAQKRADGSGTASIENLPALSNVNYLNVPPGLVAWYNLIDSAIRIEANFLLPLDEVINVDLSKPLYISELGGFYIIEEISEYTNAQTPVTVKLIKLIDNL